MNLSQLQATTTDDAPDHAVHDALNNFAVEPFHPPRLLRNPHVQTLFTQFYRQHSDTRYRRERIDTPDGDFLDLDFAYVDGYHHLWRDDTCPIVVMLHGLEGSARRGYAASALYHLARIGIRGVGLNFRSCSGEMNRTSRFYHLGETGDVGQVLRLLDERCPQALKFAIGVSLGGGVLLKYLGEQGADVDSRLVGAAVISPPFVLTGDQRMTQGVSRFYGRYLLRRLQRKVRQKAELVRRGGGDVAAALQATTLKQIDDAMTAPLHGFTSADDYYRQSESHQYLEAIQVPTLIMRSQDDPFFNADIPSDTIRDNPYLSGAFPQSGGHVGFIDQVTNTYHDDWAQRQIKRFFERILRATAG